MLAFIQSQPNIVERLLRHIETPSFVDLLGRIIQLDEIIPNSNVLEVCFIYIFRGLCDLHGRFSGFHPKILWVDSSGSFLRIIHLQFIQS